jgi:hypothetical protein
MSRVRDVLNVKGSEVLTVPPGTPVQRVAQRMRNDHIGAFVVSSRSETSCSRSPVTAPVRSTCRCRR